MTSIDQTLTAVREGASKKAAEDQKAYADIVHKTARGQAVQPELVVGKLAALGLSAETFAADVKALAHRIGLRAELDALNDRQRAHAEVNLKIVAANRELEAAIAAANAKHNEACGPLERDLAQIDTQVKRSQAAEQSLVQGVTCPVILARRDAAAKRAADARLALKRLTDAAAEAVTKTIPEMVKDLEYHKGRTTEYWRETQMFAQWQQEKAKSVADAEQRLAEARRQLDAINSTDIPAAQKELAEAEAEVAAALAMFIEPLALALGATPAATTTPARNGNFGWNDL